VENGVDESVEAYEYLGADETIAGTLDLFENLKRKTAG